MATKISELGEFALIQRLTEQQKLGNKTTLFGVGDDAAVLSAPNGSQQLVTTDLLLEGIHFDLMYVPLKHLGYKAVMVNLSDIFAMNGKPEQITVSIGISAKFSVEQIDELYQGIYLAAQRYGVDVVGGDTSSSLNGLVISITCIGYAQPEKVVYRHGAKPTDLICVTGNLGAAYMGLLLLEREKKVFQAGPTPFLNPDFSGMEYLIERQLKPEARGDVIALLAERNLLPSSMMDISDGLSSELLHIANRSKVGIRVYEERIPIDHETVAAAEDMHIAPITAALNGGEDYELLFTLPITASDYIQDFPGVSLIGYVTDPSEGCHIVAKDGSAIPLVAQGWTMSKGFTSNQSKTETEK